MSKLTRREMNDINNIAGCGDSWLEGVIYIALIVIFIIALKVFC